MTDDYYKIVGDLDQHKGTCTDNEQLHFLT